MFLVTFPSSLYNCKHVHLQLLFSIGSQAKQAARADAYIKPVLWHHAAGSFGGSKQGNSGLLGCLLTLDYFKADWLS